MGRGYRVNQDCVDGFKSVAIDWQPTGTESARYGARRWDDRHLCGIRPPDSGEDRIDFSASDEAWWESALLILSQSTMLGPARPKVLYLTHRVPCPPDKGGRIRNFHLLSWLARRASVHLACLDDEGVHEAKAGVLRGLADRVAVIRLPRGTQSARAAWSFAMGRTVSEGAFRSPELGDLLRSWARATRYHAVLASASSLVPYLQLPEFGGIPAVVDFLDVDSQKWLDYAAASRGPGSIGRKGSGSGGWSGTRRTGPGRSCW